MRRPPRAVTAIAVPPVAASLLLVPALAAAPAAAEPVSPPVQSSAVTASPSGPLGGAQLAGKGTIVNPAAGVPAAPKIKAASYLIADGDTGEVLAAKNPHGRFLPASTLKTLTALTLIPKLRADQTVRPSQEACDVEGTKVGMTPKMSYKVSDLFYALMMMSANDAAVTLAEANGGMERTLADMNAEARRINARDTLAGSPNGLDRDLGLSVKTQHTSAYDLVLILREAMRNADFRRYVQTIDHFFPAPATKKERKKGKKVGGYPIHTHNRMLPGQSHAYRGMLGGKNGYTIAAKQTFVAAARRDGHTIYISLMGADRPPSDYAAELLDWGFKARGKVKPVGELVPPGDLTPKKADAGSGGMLADTPLGGGSAGGWGLAAGTAGGALLAAGLVFVAVRRRRG
ncbi:D-alanyl-D-alanine carboxypeptidase [Actinomadura keratinilytica]|jgi:D-alanyl-D-alanine carboxypeptidase (penicillin-binding protein 5/6)|uniref:Peptidase S11 D-alanyl-D-alanine carboxypeptidase A N-terminal domain-containing protein n=1 Tax=Actinomadura keratinilytica TaxID=547461 RepID=A0ABP7ZCI8_9ACTN